MAFAGCAGFFHPAHGSTAVVMAGPWGYEAFCLAKGWRLFAEAIAAAGYPVLRYDHPGCGDSLAPAELGLDHWRDAFDAAVREALALSGAERVAVIGQGIGAAVALDRIVQTGAAAAFAALAPVVSGRTHLRELQAWGAMVGGTVEGAPSIAGFALSPQLAADIGGLDLRSAGAAVPALVAARPGRAAEEALAERLGSPGAPAAVLAFDDHEASVTDPTRSVPPSATYDAVIDWLRRTVPVEPRRAATRPIPAGWLHGAGFRERGVRFGEDGRLFGVLALPAGPVAGPAVVIASAGRDPHVGWAGYGVDLSRRLAAAGHPAFRIDLTGSGESAPPRGREGVEFLYSRTHEDDLVAAAEALAAEGLPDVVLTGRCSGGYAALHAAPRVPGLRAVVPVNLLRVVWDPEESVAEAIAADVRPIGAVARQALNPRIVIRILKGEIDPRNLIRRVAALVRSRLPIGKGAERARRRRARALVAGLAERGASVALVSGADDAGLGHIEDAFGPGAAAVTALPGGSLTLVPDTDHNLNPPAAREAVTAAILGVLARCGGSR